MGRVGLAAAVVAVEDEFDLRRGLQLYRQRFAHYGHGSADQAIVGLGAQPRGMDVCQAHGSPGSVRSTAGSVTTS